MKISIVGAGNVGATVANICASQKLGEVVLIDVVEGLAEGKALDIAESSPLQHFDLNIKGGTDYQITENSDIVVLCSGMPRTPGMTREDLRDTNAEIIKEVSEKMIQRSPGMFLIVVTNPLDTMTWVAKKYTGLPKQKIVGMAGVLDSTRLRTFVAMELNVSPVDVSAMVLGLHGPHMVPLPRYTTVSGIPITQLLDEEAIERLSNRTRKGGTEIVELLKRGSAFYAPGASIAYMVEAIVKNSRRIVPAAAWLEGEYGLQDIFMGVPVLIGSQGVEKIIELELKESELESLRASATEIKNSVAMLKV